MTMRKKILTGFAALAVIGAFATPALAERDPAYAKARSEGRVGEQPDGYLGIVGSGDKSLQDLVDDINIKRRAIYADKAKENNATLEAYALTAGCQAIARTTPGEKYRAPDGAWQTRTDAAPLRDPRCP
jgi:uncharacterized protein YdbL (DUF1318 family)